MTDSARVIVIGAGHNGLACACYLAKAGREVLVLEAADQVGGAAVTREFAPGFKVSAVSHLLYQLDPGIARDLALESHGLNLAHTDLKTISLAADGKHLSYTRDQVSGGGISDSDRSAFPVYRRRMQRFAKLLGRMHNQPPPRLAAGTRSDVLSAARLGLDIRRLGKSDMQEFLRIVGINIFDVLEENFDSDLLKGALSLDGVLGAHLGPRSNNSVFTALHRLSGQIRQRAGAVALPKGGMGAVTDALARSARSHGAVIRTGAQVTSILMDGGQLKGVELEGGEQLHASAVVSNADPRATLFGLLGPRHLEAEFARRIQHLRMRGNAAKLHLALSSPPQFTGLDAESIGHRLVVAPSLTYVEQAFDHAKYGEFSSQPVLEITLPTAHDDSLASDGQHVLSAIVQYAPYQLKQGWESGREPFQNLVIDLLAQYAPGIREQILHTELLTPLDIETQFRITGGHWHHGELALDQALMMRPVYGAAQYETPVPGLYLCGAGCHPGGGVMGSAGHNAAQRLLAGDQS